MIPRNTERALRARARAIATGVLLAGLFFVALFLPAFTFFSEPESYAVLHLLMELLAIVVSLLVFAVGWNAFNEQRSQDQLILACGFLAVAVIDLFHALSFQGMPKLVTESSPEKAIVFWLVARSVMAATLIAVAMRSPSFVSRRSALALALSVSAFTAWIGFFHEAWLPRTYVTGQGLTGFKVVYECVLVGAYGLAALIFVRRARRQDGAEFWWLACASFVMGLGEVFFLRYVAVSDVFNLLGHLYKIVAFAIIYRVVFVTGMRTPYRTARALERKFRASFEQAFQYAALLAVDGRLMDINQTALASTGMSEKEIVGNLLLWEAPWWGPSGEQRSRIEDAVRRAARGESVRFEVTHFRNQEQIQYADLSIKPFFDEQGTVQMLIAEGRDVTDQKRQADALRQSDERLRLAVHASGIGIFDHDHRTGTVFWSPEMRQICSVGADAPGSLQRYADLVHPEDRERVSTAIARAHASDGDGAFNIEHRIVRHGGEVRWLAARSQTTFEGEGDRRQPVRTVGVILDVTERRRREEALHLSDNRLRQAVRVANFGIFDHDHHTDRIYWSAEQRANYGWGPDEEVTLAKFVTQVHDADRERVTAAVLRAHDPAGDGLFDIEHRIVRRDGQVRWLTTRSQSFFEGEGASRHLTHTIGAVLDITEHKHAEDRLRELNATLEERVAERTRELEQTLHTLARAQDDLVRTEKLAALGSLVAGVAHELNTPLGNALIVASTLHDKSAQFDKEAHSGTLRRSQLDEYVRMNVQATDLMMHNLTQAADLLSSFKQVAVDQTSAKRRKFDLKDSIEEVLSTVRVLVKNKPISVRADLADGVRMDSYPGPLGQVVNNLFNNALEHAFAGRPGGQITIRTQRADDDRVVLEFCDDGVGIAPGDLPKIFDPFFTTRLGQGGSGLGLNIVHNIVTGVLGGRISVESKPGRGTCFTLQIPVVAPSGPETLGA